MREAPEGNELLRTAAQVLRDRLLPLLPAASKHDALMVVNALSIAMRQLDNGDAPLDSEWQSLQTLSLLGEPPEERTAVLEALTGANAELALLVRAGFADPGRPQRAAVQRHLLATAEQRLSESNPKYPRG